MAHILVVDDDPQVLRAVALSHVITAYVKAHTGRLSAVCGCSVAAGSGAAAGIAYLMGGTVNHIARCLTRRCSSGSSCVSGATISTARSSRTNRRKWWSSSR